MEGGGMNQGKEVLMDRGRNDRNTKLASSSAIHVDKPQLFKYDAQLLSNFEQSGEYFNYNDASVSSVKDLIGTSDEEVRSYLSKIQRGGLIQPFGCMITVDKSTLKVVAYSENCFEMLGLEHIVDQPLGSLLGVDAATLFAADIVDELAKVTITSDPSKTNPLYVNSRSRSFYAILHSIDAGIMIDLEPAPTSHPKEVWSETVKSQKGVMSVISQLQSVTEGDVSGLCDVLVQEIQNLLGYDRVMIYKFHAEDDHGEVVSEVRKSHLESYSGLHYPATDIPQAARFLFQQSQVRMICDCKARPVRIIQSEALPKPVALIASSLRAAHECHNQYMANMGSIASLVLAIVVNIQGRTPFKLWGLAVCHHSEPKYICYPVRQGLQFLTHAFSIKLQTELNLAAQEDEKRVLKMQTVLCDMLQRHSPFSIITQSPNIMDLVRCDGAAMVYGGRCCLLGVTPTESQLMDIMQWLMSFHGGSTGLSTDSLVEAGYPGALLLGDAVCGMACVRISSSHFLFWFRSHAAREIRWGGAVQRPGERDDVQTMRPRSSFTTFLQVIKNKSMAWDTAEVNAVHSMQLIMRDSPQLLDSESFRAAELRSVADNVVRVIENAPTPIFGVDKSGYINGWNSKMVELTGLQASEAFGKSFIDDILHVDSRGVCECFLLSKVMQGEELQNIEIKLQNFQTQASNAGIYLVVNACATKDCENNIVGTCFMGQDRTPEKVVQDNFIRLQGDYKTIIHSPNPLIPPMFACDENAHCTEWSTSMERLTGFMRHEVMGKTLTRGIFGHLCELKDQGSLTKFMIMLHRAIGGQDIQNLPFGFFDRNGKFVEVFITANKRVNEHGEMVGCLCFFQEAAAAADEQLSLLPQQEEAESSTVRDKEVAYLCQELKSPLSGLQYANKILLESAVSVGQKNTLEASGACGSQLMSLLEDINSLGSSVEGGRRGLQCEQFNLGIVIAATVSQVMMLLHEKDIELRADIPEETKALVLFGDGLNLQIALSVLLNSIANYTPRDGWVEIKASPGLKLVQGQHEYIHLQISLAHSGEGIPSGLIKEMGGERSECTGEQGMALNACYHRLVTLMNGYFNYTRELDSCYFRVDLELQTPNMLRV